LGFHQAGEIIAMDQLLSLLINKAANGFTGVMKIILKISMGFSAEVFVEELISSFYFSVNRDFSFAIMAINADVLSMVSVSFGI
jgi:hypothetical protein